MASSRCRKIRSTSICRWRPSEQCLRRREPARLANRSRHGDGVEPKLTIVRGTDGSRLTELGLPTPNLSTGEHNIHSPLEWTCLEEMQTAVRVLLELAQQWA